METTQAINAPAQGIQLKISDYAQLIKLRLSFLVVFSASMAFLWASSGTVNVTHLLLVSIGGFLITGTANILNQVIEKDSDKLMKRTSERPLPAGRMQVSEALLLATIMGVTGLFLLYLITPLCYILGTLAIIVYAGVYTPLKKITPLTVIPGAIAGSMPVVIGCLAAQGSLTVTALLVFLLQFTWQFPHTWAIGWVLEEEYAKAGICMTPTRGGRTNTSALLMMLSTFVIVPLGLLFYFNYAINKTDSVLLTILGLGFAYLGVRHYNKQTVKSALGVMFGSFGYLPIALLVLVLTKLFF